MGNQLVAFAPSIIRPIEFYLTDVPELQFDSNLGSTRFLKVCRGKIDHLYYVVKVFVIHEHTLPIQVYCERLNSLRNSLSLSPSPNCLPFTQIKPTDRSVIVLRPYIKYSLYDRISTRPFIQWPEKLWIAFQLLCGLAQIHKHGLSHGDLKLENVLITPGLRLLLCDFAPFKPVYLPRNNPSAIFGFFFDTSGRRSCYIAPERFHDDKSKLGCGADNLLTQEEELKHFLLPSMDIFSAGCCLIELFTEGNSPFDLSQLLSFCAGEYDPACVIDKIENEVARDLVNHMVQNDPAARSTAQDYLTNYRGNLFPEIFYSSLQSYYDILAFQPLISPDTRMNRLYQDLLTLPDDTSLSLIFTSLVTAEIRGLRSPTSKLNALESLYRLSMKLSDESILERVIPYVDFLLHDPVSHRVQAEALTTLVNCLDLVIKLPQGEYHIFSGYIFPSLTKLDQDIAVRKGMAGNIARLAQISMRYLENSFITDPDGIAQQQPQFVSGLNSQRDRVASFLRSILTDSNPIVKRVLVSTPGSLETLCTYFGRGKAHDIILSHLITFLNDKDDVELRKGFFQCVSSVAAFIGWQAAPLLVPLLKQGLTDEEEFVMREALLTIKSLAEINFFSRRFLLDLLDDTIPFLIHPNLWLRNASAGVIKSITGNLSQVDVHCHVIPKLRDYLKPSCNSLWAVNEVSVLSKVKRPLERQVYESCARAKIPLLIAAVDFLQSNPGESGKPDLNEVQNFLTRLRAEGLPQILDPVYTSFIQRHLHKVSTQRSLRQASGGAGMMGGIKSVNQTTLISQSTLQNNSIPFPAPPIRDTFVNSSLLEGFSSTIGRGFGSYTEKFIEKPRGILVAHLHEHRNAILKVCPLTAYNGYFASCSRENVRIWDAEKMEGRNVANRSRCMIKLPGDAIITNMSYSNGGNIVGVTDDRHLYGYYMDGMIARSVFTVSLPFPREEVEIPVGLESYSPNVFIVGTEMGSLMGFDTRVATREVFKLQSDLASGLLTTLASDPDQLWLCTGSSKGILTCWDLRFGIPVNTIKTGSCIRRVKPSPFHTGGVFTCSRTQNEVSLWNLETGSRQMCLWSSPLPPLTKVEIGNPYPSTNRQPSSTQPQPQAHSPLGLTFVRKYTAVVTAGTDMCIRWWELNSPNDSALLMSPEKAEQQISGVAKSGDFRFRLVDGVEVIHDISSTGRSTVGGLAPNSPGRSGVIKVPETGSTTVTVGSAPLGTATAHSIVMGNSHHNTITDVTTVTTPNQSFILTSSSDGVIKVWK